VAGLQSVVLFKIDGTDWTLDLRPDSTPSVAEGAPPADVKPDLTLTISDDNFAKLVAGKLGPQQVWHPSSALLASTSPSSIVVLASRACAPQSGSLPDLCN